MTQEVAVECCEEGRFAIEVRQADPCYGPDSDGPAIVCGMTDYGAAHVYCNVNYCPFCGAELVFNDEGFWIVPRKGN
jgi:hypothetical protein